MASRPPAPGLDGDGLFHAMVGRIDPHFAQYGIDAEENVKEWPMASTLVCITWRANRCDGPPVTLQ